MIRQSSTCSEMLRASSTSIPRYRTVLSSFVCPRRSCTALRLPWPHPRDIIERDFRDASELEKRKIVREKVVQLYGFDLD